MSGNQMGIPRKKGGDIIYCNSQNKFQQWLLDVIRQTHVGESTTSMDIDLIPVVPHKAVAEVSKIGNL